MLEIPKRYLLGAVIVVCLWAVIVIASGAGANPLNVVWNFSNPGAFGDSFGPLGTLMAGIAALSAVATLKSQQAEMRRLRDREADEDAQAAKRSFEATFFQLFEHHRKNVEAIDLVGSNGTKSGQDAFRAVSTRTDSAGIPISAAL